MLTSIASPWICSGVAKVVRVRFLPNFPDWWLRTNTVYNLRPLITNTPPPTQCGGVDPANFLTIVVWNLYVFSAHYILFYPPEAALYLIFKLLFFIVVCSVISLRPYYRHCLICNGLLNLSTWTEDMFTPEQYCGRCRQSYGCRLFLDNKMGQTTAWWA